MDRSVSADVYRSNVYLHDVSLEAADSLVQLPFYFSEEFALIGIEVLGGKKLMAFINYIMGRPYRWQSRKSGSSLF